MSIAYGSEAWNTDSREIDSAFLIMRDKSSGKIVQIQLEETEPDSSRFSGQFSVSLGKDERVVPDIYIPPQEMRKSAEDTAKFHALIQKGKLESKPAIWKKNERGQSELDVYDTKEQAAAAAKAYAELQKAQRDMEKKKLLKPLTSEIALAAAQQAEKQKSLEAMAVAAAKQAAERVRLEQIERQKIAEREATMKALSEQQKAAKKAQAKRLSEEAMAMFNKGDFKGAEAKFKAAAEMDPSDNSYYFKYGVTLYRLDKYNEALVMLRMAKVPAETEAERKYFTGLTYFRLKEYDNAVNSFTPVAASNNPVLGPSAVFYRGVVYFTQEKYELAKADFETVIDTSSDARMDEQAESYLDSIAAALAVKKLQENKFTFMGVLGGMYDSNVLLAPDGTDQGAAQDVADFRLVTIGDLEYRPIYKEKHELSAKANLTMINSLKDEAARADPYLTNLAVPYSYKGMLGKKGMRITAKPAYEMLYMDPDGAGTKSMILTSYMATVDTTLVMHANWFAGYTVELRMDDSLTADSVGVENADAGKYTVKTAQTFFLDKAKKEALIAALGVVMNAAKGDNKKYNRIEGGVTYSQPTNWGAAWSLGLALYQLDFPDADEKRTDFNTTLSTGLSKPIKDWLVWGVTGSYTKNDSNIAANEYSKFTVMTTASFISIF